jgi:glycogen debranching enzyme
MTPDLRSRLETLAERAHAERVWLECGVEWHGARYPAHNAGLRQGVIRFGPFGRDLLTSARLLGEEGFTRDVLRFVAATMGRTIDHRTGEEPGRGIHEFHDVTLRGLSTRYNAAEVSLLFLIVADAYAELAEDELTLFDIRDALKGAYEYVRRHMYGGLFVEDPALCGGSRYALRATYWKDSYLPGRVDPAYPVTYSLVQAQTIAALRSARSLAWRFGESWGSEADALTGEAVARLCSDLWDRREGRPWIAVDRRGPIGGTSSDAFQMLAYLEPHDLPASYVAGMGDQIALLSTPVGFRTFAPGQPHYDAHAYHFGSIWPFEQALIAEGADRHGLEAPMEVALRVVDALEEVGFAELCYWSDERGLEGPSAVEDQGCDLQLWTTCIPASLLRMSNLGRPTPGGTEMRSPRFDEVEGEAL